MGRLIFVLFVVGAGLWWLRRRNAGSGARPGPPERPTAPPAPTAPLPMVGCAHCGVHLPQADATFDPEGRPYCSPAHRQAGHRA